MEYKKKIMKNIQDIRQRDMGLDYGHINAPESQTVREGHSGFGLLFLIIIVGFGGLFANIMYDAGYKQAKIDYHIK